MIRFVAFVTLFTSAYCGLIAAPTAYAPAAAILNTGASSQYRSQDNIGNYAFGYNEDHSTGGTFRRESGDAFGTKIGSYGLRDADGRLRIVNYVADANGFRATISTNEPGTEPRDPANVLINKSPAIVTPAVAAVPAPAVAAVPAPVAAPLAIAPTYASPAYAPAPAYAPVYAPYSYAPASYGAYGFAAPYGGFGLRK